MIVMQRTYSTMEVVQKSRFETSNKHTWLVYSLSIIGHTVRSSIALATSSFGPSPLISLQPPHNWMVLIEGHYGWSSEREKYKYYTRGKEYNTMQQYDDNIQ